ncbi:MAG: hypothetical protein ACRCZA_07150 [Shewanella sp.]|uniref:hypothetical protein n=1 Tax=Shewanella sp. TaxID=50422 RepID=UPI003F3E53E1
MTNNNEDIKRLLLLLKKKDRALKEAGKALDMAAARLDGCGRDKLCNHFSDEAAKAYLASMESPCLCLTVSKGGCHGL